ncbi:hypothetical protein SDC9_118873 [bioreactor metagenome]|uniref:Uncharacterized protein n=1 Tax=bioreactor metagenome TaxID=1076179 RepID=A0A645C2M9_9ZZZZ
MLPPDRESESHPGTSPWRTGPCWEKNRLLPYPSPGSTFLTQQAPYRRRINCLRAKCKFSRTQSCREQGLRRPPYRSRRLIRFLKLSGNPPFPKRRRARWQRPPPKWQKILNRIWSMNRPPTNTPPFLFWTSRRAWLRARLWVSCASTRQGFPIPYALSVSTRRLLA